MIELDLKTKKLSRVLISGAIVVLLIGFICFVTIKSNTLTPRLNATASAANWNPGRIIDDNLFYDNRDMSLQEIQTFLNQKVPNCDTNGTQRYNSSMTNAQYAASQGWAAPAYVCLKDYYQVPRGDQNINNLSTNVIPAGAISAATIIKNAADTYNVSPRVLLVLLQKESRNLLSDNWPLPAQYRNPMGFGCPDTAPCDPAYEGFYNQMTNAARQFKLYKTNAASYRYKSQQYNAISYQANNPSCGSSNVFIENQATAGLYNYTPYQPNQAALNNLYGTGDGCSAYGNRNFWRIFTDWFGGTTGPDYAWQVVSQELYSDPAMTITADTGTLAPDKDYYFKVQVINNGNRTWKSDDANPVLLGTTAPYNRTSELCNSTWISCNRPAKLSEASVAPGQTGTFLFKAKIPRVGNFSEYFSLVAEGKTWLNDFGFNWQLNALPPTAKWQAVYQEIYSDSARTKPVNINALSPNTTYYASVFAKNSGNTVWSNNGINPVLLATSSPIDRSSTFFNSSWANTNRAAVLKENSVQPGQMGTFEFSLTTPSNVGLYNEYFRPVVEGSMWMNDVGMYWPLNVSTSTSQWSVISQYVYTNSTKSQLYNTDATANKSRVFMSIKARNTGNTIWKNSGTNPTRLGTNSPVDRASEFYDSSWVAQDRPAILKEPTVAPGEIGTFEFWINTPYKPNGLVINESFRPVVEGLVWMNDVGMYQQFKFNSPSTSWEYVGQGTYSDNNFKTPVDTGIAISRNTDYYLVLKLKNTGGEIWKNSTFALGTSNPVDRTSVFFDNSWPNINRASLLKETSVAPGQIGTFEFKIRTPSTTNDYNEYFRPVIEGKTWLTDIGLHWSFKVR